MLVAQADIQRYREELELRADSARLYVSSLMEEYMRSYPDASVAEVRDECIAIVKEGLSIYGDQASIIANDLFDGIMEAEGVDIASEFHTDVIDYERLEEKVRYFAERIILGDDAGFREQTGDLTAYYVKRSAYEQITRNCNRHHIRYARVTTGRESCAFCFMLSSRGFVYHSEELAYGHGYHTGCDCIVIPGIQGQTVIEGYDPEAMQERWNQCAKACGRNPGTKDVLNEVRRRDREWLYTGTCSATRLHPHPEAMRVMNTNPEVYKQWQEAVSRMPYLKPKDQKHREHIYGTLEWRRRHNAGDTPSHFNLTGYPEDETMSQRQLHDELAAIDDLSGRVAGTGYPMVDRAGNWSNTECVDVGTFVGIDRNTEEPASVVIIAYAQDAYHAHPGKVWD